MHFIAMLAYNTPVQISYEPLRTLASLILAVIVVAAGLYIVGNGKAQTSILSSVALWQV